MKEKMKINDAPQHQHNLVLDENVLVSSPGLNPIPINPHPFHMITTASITLNSMSKIFIIHQRHDYKQKKNDHEGLFQHRLQLLAQQINMGQRQRHPFIMRRTCLFVAQLYTGFPEVSITASYHVGRQEGCKGRIIQMNQHQTQTRGGRRKEPDEGRGPVLPQLP